MKNWGKYSASMMFLTVLWSPCTHAMAGRLTKLLRADSHRPALRHRSALVNKDNFTCWCGAALTCKKDGYCAGECYKKITRSAVLSPGEKIKEICLLTSLKNGHLYDEFVHNDYAIEINKDLDFKQAQQAIKQLEDAFKKKELEWRVFCVKKEIIKNYNKQSIEEIKEQMQKASATKSSEDL